MPFNPAEARNLGNAPTTSDMILKFIRDSIMDGSLAEGEPIRQDDVARLFNISKIPVREALKKLETEGLVAFQRHKGAIVSSMSEPELVQIFEVRALLESNALRFSIPAMNEETFSRAEGYCVAFAQEKNAARWAELNWQFHSCLYENAERPFLVNMIRSVNDRVERYLRVQLSVSGGQQRADQEHRQILELCRQRDTEGAAKLLHDHIMQACESLLAHLPKSGNSWQRQDKKRSFVAE